jgi:hypothetical protein
VVAVDEDIAVTFDKSPEGSNGLAEGLRGGTSGVKGS